MTGIFTRARRVRPLLQVASLLMLVPLLSNCGATVTSQDLLEAQNNTRPVARAGDDGEAPVGAQLSLDGTSSYDPDGDEISYHWAVDSKPAASQLSDSPFSVNGDRNSGTTTVIPDVEGTFIFALQVEDPTGVRSNTDRVVFGVKSTLDLPIADAGNSVSGLEGVPLCLDGSESYDPNGLTLEYGWSLVSVPSGSTLTDADFQTTDAQCCIIVDAPGTVVVGLVVNNGLEDSEPDFAFVAAASTNEGPEAVAEIVSAASCDFIRLTGENSHDPESDPLNYLWEVLAVPNDSSVTTGTAALDDPESATPSFYADVAGEYTVQLVVNDGEAFSTPVFLSVAVDITTVNSPPIVIPSPDAYISNSGPSCPSGASGHFCPEAVVLLNALDSIDPDGDFMTFSWHVVVDPLAVGSPACYILRMRDSFGDGWHNAYIDVHVNGSSVGHHTFATGSSSTGNFCGQEGDTIELYWNPTIWNNEVSYDLIDSSNNSILFSDSNPPAGLRYSFVAGAGTVGTLSEEQGTHTELTIAGPSSCAGDTNTYEVEVVVTGTDCVGDSSQSTVAVVYHFRHSRSVRRRKPTKGGRIIRAREPWSTEPPWNTESYCSCSLDGESSIRDQVQDDRDRVDESDVRHVGRSKVVEAALSYFSAVRFTPGRREHHEERGHLGQRGGHSQDPADGVLGNVQSGGLDEHLCHQAQVVTDDHNADESCQQPQQGQRPADFLSARCDRLQDNALLCGEPAIDPEVEDEKQKQPSYRPRSADRARVESQQYYGHCDRRRREDDRAGKLLPQHGTTAPKIQRRRNEQAHVDHVGRRHVP